MQLHKILQYNPVELFGILFYRCVYEILCLLSKVRLTIFHSHYQTKSYLSKEDNNHLFLKNVSLYSQILKYLKDDEAIIIEEADNILNGRLRVFDYEYQFDYEKDWLKDPVTGKYWPCEPFWRDARFMHEGCADVKYVLEVNKMNHLTIVALAYYYTGNEAYVYHIEKELNGWLKCVLRERTVANKIVMDLGFRIINFVQICLLCANSKYFVEVINPKIIGILRQHKDQIWGFMCSRWFKSGNDNNHNVGEIVGAYVAQRWLEGFGFKTSQRIYRKELEYLTEVLDKLICPSGAYIEQSSNYTRVVLEFLLIFDFIRASDKKSDFTKYDEGSYVDRLTKYMNDISYNGILPNFGDNDYAQVITPLSLHKIIDEENKLELSSEDYLDSSQWLYKSRDNNDLYLFTRVGRFAYFVEGAFVHAHNDILAFLMCAKGQEVFIDKGCLFYNSGSEIRKEFTSMSAHNIPFVEGIEMTDYLQIGYKNYPVSEMMQSNTSASECFFKGRLQYKNVEHTRSISYREGKLDIIDSISLKENSKHRLVCVPYLLSDKIVPSLGKDGWLTIKNNDGTSICRIYIEGVESVSIEDTYYAPHYALKRKTKQIVGRVSIESQLKIVTKVEFL